MKARFLALRMYPTYGQMLITLDRDGGAAHWLSSEETYQVVRTSHLDDRILPVVADFAGTKAFTRLARWLRERRFQVGLLYISDVEFFLLRSKKFPAYLANLDQLPWAEGALLVRTSTREISHSERVKGDSGTTIAVDVQRFL